MGHQGTAPGRRQRRRPTTATSPPSPGSCAAPTRNSLLPRADEILQAPGFFKELVPEFRDRLQLASWDADQCWKELERICAEGVGKHFPSDVDFDHASRVVEALARQGEKYVDRILDLLGKKVEDFETDPMTWLEIFLVELAGEMRLERAIPLVVKKLHECGDVLSEACVEALGKIGTDAAADAVAEGWLEADVGLSALRHQRPGEDSLATRPCGSAWNCCPRTTTCDIRTGLADALLSQFADEGIEPVREMVQRGAYDAMHSDLMRRLVAVSTVVGVTFPEYPIWKREAEEKLAEQERKMKETHRFFQAPATPSLPSKLAAPNERRDFLDRKPAPFLRTEKQVGRNDPCPCGSGKKYKKCCLSRGK